MLRCALRARHQAQQVILREFAVCHHVGQCGLAERQGAGLVERDRIEPADALKSGGVPDQGPAAGAAGVGVRFWWGGMAGGPPMPSRVAASLIRTPWRAPIPVPTATAVGVAKPRASGQAITTALMAKVRLVMKLSSVKRVQTAKVI